ncbi:uncharacterized protein RJT20DRAFT_6963 [Scheffersomyces xylosifermentans]|uniref:uncharacterized protein n=1 Tax=Scheffersomyces xylosifermentans TaxID=1304137 RepID=UPI00315C8A6D
MSSLFVNEDDIETHTENQNSYLPIDAVRHQQHEEHLSQRPTVGYHEDDGPELRTTIPVRFEEPDVVPIYPSRQVNCTLPLKYQQEIVEEMLTKDALLILGRGLGWDLISANLLHALSSPSVTLQHGNNHSVEKRSLVFVLNAREDEIVRLQEELSDLQWVDDEEESPFVVITGESVSSRKNTYMNGGIISITPRVLVVDLLSGVISPNDITGLYILHAERIKETSNDSFIINLYRDENDWGFIKAVSDEPESFGGFTPLATKLKILRLSEVMLWPRFHVEVSSSLSFRSKRREGEARRFVTEINTKLSYKMNKIQSAILSCIQACLNELKRHNADLATEYWDMENVHDPDFVRRIRISVDSQWHRLSYTSKQLVFDLGTLTDLLKSLITLDSVSFYQIVQGIVDSNVKRITTGSANVSMSPWLNLDESNTIISYAKERALAKYKSGSDTEEYLLEELPKWGQLGLLLDDIFHEKSISTDNQGPILIMCSSSKVVDQLGRLIETMKQINVSGKKHFSCRRYMVSKLHDYLSWKEVNTLVKEITTELNKPEEEEDEESQESSIHTSKSFSRNGQPTSKRRRTRGASATARVAKLYSGDNQEAADVDNDTLRKMDEDLNADESEEEEEEEDGQTETGGFFVGDEDDMGKILFEHISKEDQIIIQSYNERTNDALLQELSPSYIIMYEPNLSFIRRVEIFQAINKDNPAKTYFMYYGNSVEEQKHLLRIKKEKEAFTKLIREKASLSKHFETSEDNYKFQLQRNKVVNTRIAGGANFRTDDDELRVVVDVREFRSSLPNLLYRIGIKVIPCMITVGDYIVSPKICVERKSIPDLISSFKSGRLYHQCEQMFRYYELPTLLIEFDEDKSFSLTPMTESRFLRVNPLNPTVNQSLQQNLQAKLMSLLLSFPKLKIIWSSSPYETAQIFMELKSNQEEPDVGLAMDKGVNKEVVTEDGGAPIFNDDPIDFIQNIPGINNVNYHTVIQKVRSIEDLVQLSKGQFERLLGQENGRKAYYFINRKIR